MMADLRRPSRQSRARQTVDAGYGIESRRAPAPGASAGGGTCASPHRVWERLHGCGACCLQRQHGRTAAISCGRTAHGAADSQPSCRGRAGASGQMGGRWRVRGHRGRDEPDAATIRAELLCANRTAVPMRWELKDCNRYEQRRNAQRIADMNQVACVRIRDNSEAETESRA